MWYSIVRQESFIPRRKDRICMFFKRKCTILLSILLLVGNLFVIEIFVLGNKYLFLF